MININKINKKLYKQYGDKVKATLNEKNHSIVVSGNLDNWDDAINACVIAKGKDEWHCVNHIKVKGIEEPKMRMPLINDNSLDGQHVDVLVIGGGIIGASILRELSKWKLNSLLIEKEEDLAMGASSRNDGEVHPGVDQKTHNLKLKYELLGNRMYEQVCKELEVPFKRCGQYVVFKGLYTIPFICLIARQKRKLGITDTRVAFKKELYRELPNIDSGYVVGIHNSSAACVCPYGITIAYGENAVSNGARVSLNTAAIDMEVVDGKIISVKTNRGTIYPKVVINAAGVFSDNIAKMAKDEFFSIHPRRGTECILDNKAGGLTDKVVTYRSANMHEKNTKGGGILKTVHGNILVGPDAVETYEKENYETHKESIDWLFNKQQHTIPTLSRKDIITYFTGVRAPSFEEDFIIEKGRETHNIIHVAGIQSPGITAAPAIALDVEKMAVSMFDKVERNENFNPHRKAIPVLKQMSDEKRDELIKQNPDYGVIVCRCEEISKGEIIDCLKSNISVSTIDAIKRRIRPGMGRCQGGFCSPLVSKIIAEYENKQIKDVTKSGNDSYVSLGDNK